jgi:hypothetical protein
MHEQTRLREMILSHWCLYRPQMVEELRRNNQLDQSLSQAEERTADLLHELLSVKKLQYQEAWELATREWAFLPTEVPR